MHLCYRVKLFTDLDLICAKFGLVSVIQRRERDVRLIQDGVAVVDHVNIGGSENLRLQHIQEE